MAVAEEQIQTFAAFEGKLSGNTVKGVSIIQEGPALGHGVWVDRTMLEQVKKLAAGKGRLKAKLNHWSSLEDTVGYYENFRLRGGKCLADLTLFDTHQGKEHLLEMISEMPASFGVSIMFRPDEPEYDKANDRYNARVRELYSADFVDTPAANAGGVFEEGIDSAENDMPNDKKPEAPAFDVAAELAALRAELAEVKALASIVKVVEGDVTPPPAPEPPKPDAAFAALSAQLAEAVTAIKALSAAPPTQTPPAPPSEAGDNDKPKLATYAEAKTAFIGNATGFDRVRQSMAFDSNPNLRPAHLR